MNIYALVLQDVQTKVLHVSLDGEIFSIFIKFYQKPEHICVLVDAYVHKFISKNSEANA